MKHWPALAWLGLVLGCGALGYWAWRARTSDAPAPQAVEMSAEARFVGATTCAGCHQGEYKAWRGSQHAQAMQHATPETVLADFNQSKLRVDGKDNVFFRRNGDFMVRTAGADGQSAEFSISHTFGVFPLQQYLVTFPDGRLQALPFAWDARAPDKGGQRWFYLYPDDGIVPGDPLHWTRLNQNWNWMCADCHSTNLQRNYDAATDRYDTRFSEMNVACEACHGPASRHLQWAQDKNEDPAQDVADKGLVVRLDERRDAAWIHAPGTGTAFRNKPRESQVELGVCAQCHSRRAPLVAGLDHKRNTLESHDLALLEDGSYFPDGQQREEVYNVGSFLQSKMHAQGVSCSDCHEPHSGKLRLPGDQVCSQCHAPAKFSRPEHTLHDAQSTGASCSSCHMPTRAYMVIDERHDHSFRIPRPDLGGSLGTPDACTSCHKDRSQEWAAGVIEKAFGPTRKGFQTFGPALHAARTGEPSAASALAGLVEDPSAPGIARATALREMRHYLEPTLLASVEKSLRDPDPLVRGGALDSLQAAPLAERMRLALPLLDDRSHPVRIKGAFVLAAVDPASLDARNGQLLRSAFAEYEQAQRANSERPEAHFNLGLFFTERTQFAQAETEYRAAMTLQPDFGPAYANLAELYRSTDRPELSEAALLQGLRHVPRNADLLHALGLQRVRQKRTSEALDLLGRAAAAAPSNPRFAYVHAVALHDGGRPAEAVRVLAKARIRFPRDADIAAAHELYSREAR